MRLKIIRPVPLMIFIISFVQASFSYADNFLTAVVVKEATNQEEAIELAKEVSAKLQHDMSLDIYNLDSYRFISNSTEKENDIDISDLLPVGFRVSIFQNNNSYWVTSYVGGDISDPETSFAVSQAKQHFDNIKIKKIKPKSKTDIESSYTALRRVIILGSFKDFNQAVVQAKEISQQSSIPFSDRGMIFDSKKGLVFKKTEGSEPWESYYFGRRDNSCGPNMPNCISIERSSFYSGFTKDYYIIIGGISAAHEENNLLNQYKKVVPDAYIKNTTLYMGCTH